MKATPCVSSCFARGQLPLLHTYFEPISWRFAGRVGCILSLRFDVGKLSRPWCSVHKGSGVILSLHLHGISPVCLEWQKTVQFIAKRDPPWPVSFFLSALFTLTCSCCFLHVYIESQNCKVERIPQGSSRSPHVAVYTYIGSWHMKT